jgi:glycosyltransferase involved in cell wall biosynthesis/predicted metal-dependent phosphoesterase TrpH
VRSPDAGIRAELHLHSRASTDTGSWFLNRGALPESYTSPQDAYRAAKAKGMHYVALTDHNTLAGVAEIAHLPDVIVGVEVTTAFPGEEDAQVHVLVWGLDDAQWAEIDYLRPNLFEMLDHVRAAGLPHSLAHPLHRVGGHLSADHLEKLLLVFSAWEGRNGARPQVTNELAARIANSATPDYLAKLSEKHGIAPVSDGTIALTGGSDDHSGFDVARAWTETPPAADVGEVLEHLRAGRTRPGGLDGTSQMLAHAVSTLFVKAHIDAGAAAIPSALRSVIGDLIGFDVPAEAAGQAVGSERGQTFAQDIMGRLRRDRRLVRQYRKLGRGKRRHERLRLVTGWLHEQLVQSALGNESGPITSSFSRRMESGAGAAAMAVPYFLAASYMRGEIGYSRKIGAEFFGDLAERPARAAMLTDTFDEINGVAGTMRRLADFAQRDGDGRLVVVTPSDRAETTDGLVRLKTASSMQMPAYNDPGWRLGIPSILDLLDLVEEREIDVIHAATPGPMGIGGLIVARSLGIPFVASYHTELGRYALDLTGDRFFAQLAAKAVGWFYRQAEVVYTPTQATADGLATLGIDRERITEFTRGVDTELFDPERRSRWTRRKLGASGDDVVLLYVGRISKEKALPVLADAFKRAAEQDRRLVLALVGEGPLRPELERQLAGTRHKFLGPLTGTALASAYASADLFCLPSETETFGQVSVEAAASGLPVIVVDRGGARETIVEGTTGLVAPAGDPAGLAVAISALASDPERRREMGRAGIAHARSRRSWDDVFEQLVGGYDEIRRAPQQIVLSFETPSRSQQPRTT